MKGKIRIRDFLPGDLEKILRYREEVARESFPELKMESEKARKAILSQLENHPGTLKVAESEGKPIGYIMFTPKSGSLGKYGRITSIFVERPWRKQGVGALLLEEAEKSLLSKGINRIYAEITNTNKPSLDFFRKSGYKEKRTVVEKRV